MLKYGCNINDTLITKSLILFQQVETEIHKFLDNTFIIQNIDIIPNNLEAELNKFKDSGVAAIDFTGYDTQVSSCSPISYVYQVNMFHVQMITFQCM